MSLLAAFIFSSATLAVTGEMSIFPPASEWLETWLFLEVGSVMNKTIFPGALHKTLWALSAGWESWRQNKGNGQHQGRFPAGDFWTPLVAVKEFYTLLAGPLLSWSEKDIRHFDVFVLCENPLSRLELLCNFTSESCIFPSLWTHVTKSLQRIEPGTLSPAWNLGSYWCFVMLLGPARNKILYSDIFGNLIVIWCSMKHCVIAQTPQLWSLSKVCLTMKRPGVRRTE